MRATDIRWDTDGDQEALDSLPDQIRIPPEIPRDDAGSYISDVTGFCHTGFCLEPDEGTIELPIDAAPFLPAGISWKAYYVPCQGAMDDLCRFLYGDCSSIRTKAASGAQYPAVCIFETGGDPDLRRCLGTAGTLMVAWRSMFWDLSRACKDMLPRKKTDKKRRRRSSTAGTPDDRIDEI